MKSKTILGRCETVGAGTKSKINSGLKKFFFALTNLQIYLLHKVYLYICTCGRKRDCIRSCWFKGTQTIERAIFYSTEHFTPYGRNDRPRWIHQSWQSWDWRISLWGNTSDNSSNEGKCPWDKYSIISWSEPYRLPAPEDIWLPKYASIRSAHRLFGQHGNLT